MQEARERLDEEAAHARDIERWVMSDGERITEDEAVQVTYCI